jgi:hypothetical protein
MNFDFILKGVDSVVDFFDESYDYVMGQIPLNAAEEASAISSNWDNPVSRNLVDAGASAVKGLFGEDSGGTSSKKGYSSSYKTPRYMDQGDAMQFGSSVSSPNFRTSDYGYENSVNFLAIERNWIERMRDFANLGEKVK